MSEGQSKVNRLSISLPFLWRFQSIRLDALSHKIQNRFAWTAWCHIPCSKLRFNVDYKSRKDTYKQAGGSLHQSSPYFPQTMYSFRPKHAIQQTYHMLKGLVSSSDPTSKSSELTRPSEANERNATSNKWLVKLCNLFFQFDIFMSSGTDSHLRLRTCLLPRLIERSVCLQRGGAKWGRGWCEYLALLFLCF